MEVRPDISVVIVSYNVCHYLKLCLDSVFKAANGHGIEVFVVDNASSDDSVDMVKQNFPQVRLIANSQNLGFSRANNIALKEAKGAYHLLLNPDTIVPETIFDTCLKIMKEHPEVGAAGIRMIDGSGHFLPESKRGLPTPRVSFFKITGLYRLFPGSAVVNKYYLGNTSPLENQYVEILAGAFMLVKSEVAEEIGYLPEEYFMYGEDIDFSYQILRKGYKNFYIAEDKILHFKGESTKKGTLNYVYVFYKAMALFSAKYFGKGNAFFYNILISIGIIFTALIAALKRLIISLGLPVFEFLAIYAGFWYVHDYWEKNHRFISGGEYPDVYVYGILPLYTVLLVTGVLLSGGYKRHQKANSAFRGLLFGFVVILILYALSPENWRFSRAIIVLGTLWAFLWSFIYRNVLLSLNIIEIAKKTTLLSTVLITKNPDSLTNQLPKNLSVKCINPEVVKSELPQLKLFFLIAQPDYVVFDSDTVSYRESLDILEKLSTIHTTFLFKIPTENVFVGTGEILNLSSGQNKLESQKIPVIKLIYDFLLTLLICFGFFPKVKARYNVKFDHLFEILKGNMLLFGYGNAQKSIVDINTVINNSNNLLPIETLYEFQVNFNPLHSLRILRMLDKVTF
ncbi:glycosyltransferase family 2 protein [Schleiferia thermophila]|uniref:GT2 family glycosyltransferase n=1 Tax=Schleiferia thermophila TaxID=884107 RepID=A0A368ZYB1_9FLAO|nr:glycosyltransferase family 2 protein [Schleiferia thermophila]RCX01086.1 GT2 family glycosyltransferase [Schleiferia thermophila]GCD80884.1 hypothetical protein JCM30197_21310 [Schleiferia thermophila]